MESDQKSQSEKRKEWHEDSRNWKWGVFYFNREDKRLLPPKRIPMMGWTVNFANPLSVLFMLGLIAILIYVTTLIKT